MPFNQETFVDPQNDSQKVTLYDSSGNPVSSTSATLYDGTQTATGSGAALNGGVSQSCSSVLVQNDPSSTTDIYVGNATSQSMRLTPGNAESVAINDVSKVFVKAVSGSPRVNWHARS